MPTPQPLVYEAIHLIEFLIGIPRPEVISPATKHGIDPFRIVQSQRATACDPEEVHHPFRSGMLSVAFAM
jgi:hypothetical protein